MDLSDYNDCFLNDKLVYLSYLSDITNGNKLQIDEIPGAGRIVQFFGSKEFSATFNGVINVNSLEEKNEIDRILNTQQEATLTLPYGERYIIYIENNSSNIYSQGSIGIYNLNFNFTTSKLSSQSINITIASSVKNANLDTQQTKLERFSEFVNVATTNIGSATSAINNALSNVQQISATTRVVSAQANLLADSILAIESTITQLLNVPAELASAFDNLIADLTTVFQDDDERLTGMYDLVILNDITPVQTTSQNKILETETNNLIDALVVASAVENYVSLTLLKTFIYESDVELALQQIEAMRLIIDKINDPDIKAQLNLLLNILQTYLDDKKQFTKRKYEYKLEINLSDTDLCYRIFGDVNDENLTNVLSWNPHISRGFIPKGTDIIFYI